MTVAKMIITRIVTVYCFFTNRLLNMFLCHHKLLHNFSPQKNRLYTDRSFYTLFIKIIFCREGFGHEYFLYRCTENFSTPARGFAVLAKHRLHLSHPYGSQAVGSLSPLQ